MSAIGNVVNVATQVVYDPAGQSAFYTQVNGGVYRTNPAAANDGEVQSFRVNDTGELYMLNRVQNPLYTQGAAADNAAASGYPVLAAGKYQAALPTYDDGDAASLHTDINGKLHARATELEALLTTLNGYVDGIEGLLTSINSNTDGLEGYVDGLEALATSLNGYVDQLEGYVDGLETLITSTNTKLDTLNTTSTISKNSGAVDANTTRVKLASEDADLIDGIEASLSSIDAGTPAALGQTTKANSMPVAIASDQDKLGVKVNDYNGNAITSHGGGGSYIGLDMHLLGKFVFDKCRNDHSSSPISTGAWTALLGSLAQDVHAIEIFDSSGETLVLGYGGAGSETQLLYVTPGGNGIVPCRLTAGTRIAVKAISAATSSGELTINFYGLN